MDEKLKVYDDKMTKQSTIWEVKLAAIREDVPIHMYWE